MSRLIALALCVVVAGSAAAPAVPLPPPTRTVDVVDHRFGRDVPDPYRWMEGADNAEFKAWLTTQGAYARERLDATATLSVWHQRLQAVGTGTTVHRLLRRFNGRLFFLRIAEGRRGVLMVRDADGTERTLLDPNPSSGTAEPASITEFSPSFDGRLVAVNVDRGGNEVTTVTLLDVATGSALPESLESVWGEFPVTWFADGSGFTYIQMAPRDSSTSAPSDPLQNMRTRIHRLHGPVTEDPVVLGAGLDPRLAIAPVEFPQLDLTATSDWAVATMSGARQEMRVCVAPKADAIARAARWNCVADYTDQVQGYALRGTTLLLLTVEGAPNGKILALDLAQPDVGLANARTVVAESRDVVLTGLGAARDSAYVRRMSNGLDTFGRLAWDGGQQESVPMPYAGSATEMSTAPGEDGLLFTVQDWTRPRAAFAYEATTRNVSDLRLGSTSPVDYRDLVVTETEVVSRDGTRVPLTILHRKDLRRDGGELAILAAYGAYGYAIQPTFDALRLEWARAGHVYAIAHVRGGGEKGATWWKGGKGTLKYRGVEDFVACARTLVERRYTSAAKLTASGASAGGVLIGGAITQVPSQFGAAVIHAGVLDLLRGIGGANGANQIAEFGDPATATGFAALVAMDPSLRVRDHVAYPAVLLAVGLNDSRVPSWQSGKFGARLLAASPGTQGVWFRTSGGQGHFSGSLTERADESADTYAFIEDRLGGRRGRQASR